MSVHRTGETWQVRLRAPDGSQLKRTFRTKTDAERWQRAEMANITRGAWTDPRPDNQAFKGWAEEWLGTDTAKRPKTLTLDGAIIRNQLLPVLGSKKLATITPRDIQSIVNTWTTKFAPATARRYYAVLRAMFNAAAQADLIGRSPCRGVRLPKPEWRPRVPLTPTDVDRIADEGGPDYRALVYIGAVLGLRFSEIAGLRVHHIDHKRREITVNNALSEVKGHVLEQPPKSVRGLRTLSMPATLVAELRSHLCRRGLTGGDSDALIFVSPSDGPLRYSNFRTRIWEPACHRAGLPNVGTHDLRRANATAMIRSGVDIRTAQQRLGHADPRLTLGIYAQATTDGDRDAADRLGRFFAQGET